jgi:HTH-type transcriptional regulator/antitoxin HigA
MMNIRPIRNQVDYDWALAEVERYFDGQPALGTPDADRFDMLCDLIEAYEARRWAIDPPDPVEAINYTMTISGRSQKDLAELLGSKLRASEILKCKRALTLPMIVKLNRQWGVPAEALIPLHAGDEAD